MSTNFSAVDCVISIGDEQITGKDCIVEQMVTNVQNKIDPVGILGCRDVIPLLGNQLITIDLRLVCSSMETHNMLFSNFETKKIRNKKVDDCSIQELLFAVRSKLKRDVNL